MVGILERAKVGRYMRLRSRNNVDDTEEKEQGENIQIMVDVLATKGGKSN